MDRNERTPLLTNQQNASAPPEYTEAVQDVGSESRLSDVVTVPPVEPDELPPPYTPSASGGMPVINCKVCQSMINIEGKTHQHVVKCNVCNEATPIKAAPPGKKYVRCPCNCLLICKSTSQRIACPRPNCKKIINLSPSSNTVSVRPPGMSRVSCAYCQDTFLFNVMNKNKALARCPHCRKVSSVGKSYARNRAFIYSILAIVFVATGIITTIMTHTYASHHGGMYVAYIVAFLLALFFFIRGVYYCAMKVSEIDGPA